MLKSETSWEFLAFNVRPTSSVNEESTTADIGAELVITENAGRGLSATKDFEAGEVIFTEVALILGPAQSVGQHFCASCSQPLSHGVLQECPNKCGLRTCSEKCLRAFDRHTQEECDLVKKIQDKNPEYWLSTLRVLLLRKNHPDQFERLLLLEDHLEDRKECPIMKANKTRIWSVLKTYVGDLTEGLALNDIQKICGILDANSFRVDKHGTRGVFAATSMVNHNCMPNARVVFDGKGHLSLKAKKPIKAGDDITITYCTPLWNTRTRQAKLRTSKFFLCTCKLCSDPTENGSYMSAVICTKCGVKKTGSGDSRGGRLLPVSFLSKDPEWKCDQCPFKTTDAKVTALVSAIQTSCAKIANNPRETAEEKSKQLEEFLKKRCDVSLPGSHQVMIDCKTELGHFYDIKPTMSTLARRLDLQRERIALLDKIEGEATESRLKGFLVFRLHTLLIEKFVQLQRKGALSEKECGVLGNEIGSTLKSAASLLLDDQGCPPQLLEAISQLQASNGN